MNVATHFHRDRFAAVATRTISPRGVFQALLVFAMLAISAQQVHATTIISSSPFSLGYGFIRLAQGVGQWDTSETSGANTPTTIGDFTFSPTISGSMLSNGGPTFLGRVLTTGGTTGVGRSDTFSASIAGSYNGPIPNGAIVALQLNIDEIRVHAVGHSSFTNGGDGIAFVETTPGHMATSAELLLSNFVATGTPLNTASNYEVLSWDPDDFAVLGTNSLRSFVLQADDVRGIDGFEIFGTIDVTILPVPEPSTGLLLGLGTMMLRRRRHRRTADRKLSA